MNQHHLVVKQSSVADLWATEEADWQRSHSYKPVARLTMVLTWPRLHRATSRCGVESETPTFFTLAAVVGLLLAFAIVLLGTGYLSGVLVQRIRSLPHYNQPQAQYSDVGKWQGDR